ncbi:ornithine decarboxylase-like isoform X2 [Centruroides sculpturatus]|nr:ornithine decarboxylase-like isoform X2 [Centruroides sculpturatus]
MIGHDGILDETVWDVAVETISQPDREDPFFVVDLTDIERKYKLWKLKMPRITPFYATKCNDCPEVLRYLASIGVNFDCASKTEIETVINLGVDPSRIIYANPCKHKCFIKYAADVGVKMMTFDNEIELDKIKSIFPRAELVIRIKVDDSHSSMKLSLKFGCEMRRVARLLKTAKSLHLNVIGVSFHVGSGCKSSWAYSQAISDAKEAFDIAKEIGYNFYLLDIGGGFPGTKTEQKYFEEIAAVTSATLDAYFPEGCGVRIIAEPGRYFVGSAFTLCTNIIAKRDAIVPGQNGDEPARVYYLNDGVYGSFNIILHEPTEFIPYPLSLEEKERKVMKTSLWGPTCDSIDRIIENCYLPEMNIGEWLLFENMGGYSLTPATTFNGFQKPEFRYIAPLRA